MAVNASSLQPPTQAHCTGRFDYVLPATLRYTGGQQTLYLVKVDSAPLTSGTSAEVGWKHRLGSVLAEGGQSPTTYREFDLAGVGRASWLTLQPTRPDLVTLLAMRSLPASNAVLFLQFEASAGREAAVERGFAKLAPTWTPGTAQGFCTGPGAFVTEPGVNERALASYSEPGLELTVQTETVSAPDDGQSSGDALPPGGQMLSKGHRSVAGLDGIEERMQVPGAVAGQHRIYSWVFAGRPADGLAPRIRFTATAVQSRAAELDAAWSALTASWRPRPTGMR